METLKGSDTLIEGKFEFDPCKVNRVDSSSHVTDVPIKGISLFVELKGGVASKPDIETVRDINVNVENSLLHENRVKFNVDVGQQESEVNVGDLVWAIIKRQKWWPGIICDAANAANVAANRPTREDDVLVKFFGNGKFVWCSPYEVRPFVGYFDHIPNQSTAKKFHLAFEKAVTVFGYRVKREFTCSCLSSFNMKEDKRCNLGEYSVTRFEPAAFLEHIKDLGKDISRGQKTDNVAKHNCLSAFYRSLGHLQIPMHQLKPANGSPSKIKTEDENGYFYFSDDVEKLNETRERRKSSFLSYPGEFGIDGLNVDVTEGVDLSQTSGQSQPAKKPRKKWTRKKKAVEVNVCSSDVLSQLRFAAQDCFFPCESKTFDSVQRFVSGFRKVTFKDSAGEIPVNVLNHQVLQETLSKKAKKKDKTVISPAFGNGFSGEIPAGMVNHQILQETLPKKVRKKKEKFILPASGNNLYHDPRFMNFQNVGPLNFQAQSMENKKTEWQTNQATIFNYGHVPPPPCKLEPIRPKNVADNVTSMPTWNGDVRTPPPNVHHMEGLYQAPMYFTNQFGSAPPYFTGNLGQPQTGLGQNGLTRVPKKRGRKRKNADLQPNPGSAMNPQAYPGSVMNPQAQAYPGSVMNPQAYPGSALNPQAYPGLPMNPQGHPGLPMNPQAYPGLPMNPQAYPGSAMNPQAYPGSVMNLQAYPGSTLNPLAYPGSAMNPQAYPGSAMNPQAYPGSTMNPQANPGSVMNPQTNPGSTMNPQANPGSNVVPKPNENVTGPKRQKREKKSKEIGVQCIDLSYNKVQQDDSEVKGTAFLLKFSSDYPLPTNQDLNSIFSKFGALIESETQVSNENLSGQVVFLDSSSAGGAFWGLQNEKPFGPVLVNYKIQHLAGSESLVPFKTPLKSPSGPKPIDPKAVMPDLNSNSNTNTNSSEVQIIKRSQTIEEIRLPLNDNYLSYTKVQQGNEPVTGTALILKFSPNYPLPSSQDLNLVFCKYGELNELETRVCVQTFTGQVVFVNPSVAGDAINKFQKEQPFGPALLSYRVDHLYNVQSAVQVKSPVNKDVGVVQPAVPVQVVKSAGNKDFGVIKKNLEMMNMMLEKSGESLSPEMRVKLESEIKGLMKKLSVMDGSSSASASCL